MSASTSPTTAKDAVLARVRAALADVPASETADDVPLPRLYRTNDEAPRHEILDLFVERVVDYKAVVRRVKASDLPRAIAESCASRGVTRLAVPADLPEGWAPPEITLLRDPGLTNADLESSHGVLTTCSLGIAQTGTVVLDSGPGQGRRALSLLPDYHLCVVRDDQVVGLVPEAIARLEPTSRGPGRPITFISGPSATSDIELIRVEGVHGPRTLEVLLVETGA